MYLTDLLTAVTALFLNKLRFSLMFITLHYITDKLLVVVIRLLQDTENIVEI